MGGGQSKNRITAQDRAILDMKVQRDKLRQYQKRVHVVLDREDQLARELLRRGDRKRALLALRRRKYQEQMILTTDQQLSSLEQLMGTIEFSLLQKDVLFGLEQGNRVLAQLNKEMRIEDVERLAEETADAIAYQEEVSEILRANMTTEDEEAVERELELLERQEADRLQLTMPHAPSHAPPQREAVDIGDEAGAETEAEAESPQRAEPLLA